MKLYTKSSVVAREFSKLAAKFYGPFKILDKIRLSIYKWIFHLNPSYI